MTQKYGSGIGHGKLILCGEHSVVYGHPAIAFATNHHAQVTLEAKEGPTQIHAPVQDPRLEKAIYTLIEPMGWAVSIQSTIPIGRGMGSSAAISVALVRAIAALNHSPLSLDQIMEEGMRMERVFHGNPSGLDITVATLGECIEFHRGPPTVTTPLSNLNWDMTIIDSGAQSNTREMVEKVASKKPGVDSILADMGQLTRAASKVLDAPEALGPLLTKNHHLLRQLGVSTPALDYWVDRALDLGAWGAKLSGSGGGGVVMVLTPHSEDLIAEAHKEGCKAWICTPRQREVS